MRWLYVLLSFLLGGTAPALAIEWQALFIAGDDSIENFDNGRRDLTSLLDGIGDMTSIQVTSSPRVARRENAILADRAGLNRAFGTFHARKGQGCFIHMTSHGTQDGLYLSRLGYLSPREFARRVDGACGKYPTVVLISACYSGVFLTDELKGPNRIILTAAREDRPSFGCSSDTRYTFWDSCLLDTIEAGTFWTAIYDDLSACIRRMESEIGAEPSEPQAYFGANTSGWEVLY